jgi:hypothetical protein
VLNGSGAGLVTFLAFPSPPVLVERVGWFDMLQTSRADEMPLLRRIDSHPVENIVIRSASIARFDPNPFDWHLQLLG